MSDVTMVRESPEVPWRSPSFWWVMGLFLVAILGLTMAKDYYLIGDRPVPLFYLTVPLVSIAGSTLGGIVTVKVLKQAAGLVDLLAISLITAILGQLFENGSNGKSGGTPGWRIPLLFAAPVSLLVLGLFYYWFAVADRYFIFLYFHDMGSVVPDTSPFSPVTSSRYWMAGLVASGAVLALYTTANWLLGRLSDGYHPPAWWRVWVLSAVLLVIGIPIITMSANDPVLPIANAAQATAATLVGLCLALLPGEMAARRPAELFWLALDGMGLMLILVTVAGLQNLPRWLASGGMLWLLMLILVLAAAGIWLLVVIGLRLLVRTPLPNAATLFLAGLTVAYVLMPLAHHVLGTDGLFYITNSNNFFADSVLFQIAIWVLVAGLAWLLTRLRHSLIAWRSGSTVMAT